MARVFDPINRAAEERYLFRLIIPAFPAFNIYSGVAKATTALGPVCVATAANELERWDVEVIDENNYRQFGPKDGQGRPDHADLQRLRPADVVGFYGGLSSTVPRLYELAGLYTKWGVPTIAGGQHFVGENIEEALRSGVDVVVLGEGEEAIKELLLARQEGRDVSSVDGIAFLDGGRVVQTPERALMTCFGKYPLPDFALVRNARFKLYPVGWVRGCGMDCEFCTVKGKVRAAPPERAVAQIAQLLETRNARHFFIVDDLFGQRRTDALRFCALVADYQQTVRTRLDITVQIRLDKATDAELLQAMRRAGINTVAIGFESPIEEELRAMNKKLKPERMLDLTRLYHKAGFLIHGMFIFGYPMPDGVEFRMPTAQRVKRFRRFIRKGHIDTVQVLLPVPLPGTELTRRLQTHGRIFPRDVLGWEYYDGNFPLIEPDPPVTPEEMQKAIRQIMGRFYRFRSMFKIGLNVLVFPAMLFFLHNVKVGWRIWYRSWRNDLWRFAGWIIIRRWTREFNKGVFSRKLRDARQRLGPGKKPGALANNPA
ncbi:MAG: B12-binding domain-containing radical SAM protein [Kiritimatiellae bacterium]|nr:B12-binding domain-containing radical SAM protein [Kiritimatiellia bacterium]